MRVCECGEKCKDRFSLCKHRKTCKVAIESENKTKKTEKTEKVTILEKKIEGLPKTITIKGKPIRTTVDPIRVSAYDLIAEITKQSDKTVRTTFFSLKLSDVDTFQFSGRGQRDTPTVDASGAVKIINALEGVNAAKFRSECATDIIKDMNGEPALISQIKRTKKAPKKPQIPKTAPKVVKTIVADEIQPVEALEIAQPVKTPEIEEITENIIKTKKKPEIEELPNSAEDRTLVNSLVSQNGEQIIPEMRDDGYINATKMCKAGGKLWGNYFQNSTTKEFLEALSSRIGTPIPELVVSKMGGNNKGTWVHPKVAIHLANWVSPQFYVSVVNLVERYLTGKVTTEESKQEAAIINRHQFCQTNATVLESIKSDNVNMRAPQLYFRQIFGNWSNMHPYNRPDEVLSAEELAQCMVVKFGSQGENTERQVTHCRSFSESQVLDSCLTPAFTHLEMIVKDIWKNKGELYTGLHEDKDKRDTELLLVKKQETYNGYFDFVMTKCAQIEQEISMSPEVLIEIEKTKQKQADSEVRKYEADAQTKQSEFEADARKVEAVSFTEREVQKTKQKTLDFEMMKLTYEMQKLKASLF